jgi:ketosteroid isomerase-like protein
MKTFPAGLGIGMCVWLVASGCASSPRRGDHAARPDRTALEAQLLETDRAFSRMSAAQGMTAAFMAYVAEDATMLPIYQDMVRGRNAIRELMADGSEGVTLTWQPVQAEVTASGEMGYTIGVSEVTRTLPDGKPETRRGKYLTIWRRQSDGSWKWTVDIGNPSQPPK